MHICKYIYWLTKMPLCVYFPISKSYLIILTQYSQTCPTWAVSWFAFRALISTICDPRSVQEHYGPSLWDLQTRIHLSKLTWIFLQQQGTPPYSESKSKEFQVQHSWWKGELAPYLRSTSYFPNFQKRPPQSTSFQWCIGLFTGA